MSVFIPISKKGNAKECSNYCTIALISHATTVLLKNLQVRLQQCVNNRTFRCTGWIQKRQRNQRSNCQHPLDHRKSKRIAEKHPPLAFGIIDHAKAFDCVDHNKLENSERDGNTRPPDLPLEKPICRSGSNSQNWTRNNRLVPNRKRSTSRLYIVTLLI